MTLSTFVSSLNFLTIGPWEFNGFDAVVLVILVISGLYAMSRGLLREVISLAALLIAAIITLYVYGQFRFEMHEVIKDPAWLADGVLALGTFAISYLILVVIMSKIGKAIAGKESGLIDRLLGAGFGVARGLIVATLVMMFFTSKYRASNEAQEFKRTLQENGTYAETLESMPPGMREQIEADPAELPSMFANSVFYPLLDKIGVGIRSLPFTKWKTYAERIKEGELEGVGQDVVKDLSKDNTGIE